MYQKELPASWAEYLQSIKPFLDGWEYALQCQYVQRAAVGRRMDFGRLTRSQLENFKKFDHKAKKEHRKSLSKVTKKAQLRLFS